MKLLIPLALSLVSIVIAYIVLRKKVVDFAEVENKETKPAEFLPRAAAYTLDVLMLSVPAILLGYIARYHGGVAPLAILYILLFASYKIYMEYKLGQTVGKLWVGIKVVSVEGGPLRFSQAMKRYVVYGLKDLLIVVALFLNTDRQFCESGAFQDMYSHCEDVTKEANYMYMGSSALLFVIWLATLLHKQRRAAYDMFSKSMVVQSSPIQHNTIFIIILCLISLTMIQVQTASGFFDYILGGGHDGLELEDNWKLD